GRGERARQEGPRAHPRVCRSGTSCCRGSAGESGVSAPIPNSYRTGPDERGFFGLYGGRFVAETLMPLILELDAAYEAAKKDPAFRAELESLNTHYAARPSPPHF